MRVYLYSILYGILLSAAYAGPPATWRTPLFSFSGSDAVQGARITVFSREEALKEELVKQLNSAPQAIKTRLSQISSVPLKWITQEELTSSSGKSSIQIHAWTEEKTIYLSTSVFDSPALVHEILHEVFHLLQPANVDRWIAEGMAETFAWRMTGQLPLVATSQFLNDTDPRSLLKSDFNEFTLDDYGQSFLVFYRLWLIKGDSLFDSFFEKGIRTLSDLKNYEPSFYLDTVLALVGMPLQSEDSFPFLKKSSNKLKTRELPGLSFWIFDATDSVRSSGEIHVNPPADVATYLVVDFSNGVSSVYDLRVYEDFSSLPQEHIEAVKVLFINQNLDARVVK
jgi:hypothetical protein